MSDCCAGAGHCASLTSGAPESPLPESGQPESPDLPLDHGLKKELVNY